MWNYRFNFENCCWWKFVRGASVITKTITGLFPLTWQDGIGGDLVDYSITGAEGGVGDYTCQKNPYGGFTDTSGWTQYNSVLTVENGEATLTPTSENPAEAFIDINTIHGHKYFMIGYAKNVTSTKCVIRVALSTLISKEITFKNYGILFGIVEADNQKYTSTRYIFSSYGGVGKFKNVMFFDLTELYGAGSEPNNGELVLFDIFKRFGKSFVKPDKYCFNTTIRNINIASNNVDDYAIIGSYNSLIYYNKKEPCYIKLFDNDVEIDISGVSFGITASSINPINYKWLIENGSIYSMSTSNLINDEYANIIFIYPNNIETLNKILSRFKIMVVKGSVEPTEFAPYFSQENQIYRTTQLTAGQTISMLQDNLPHFDNLPTGYLQIGVDTAVAPSEGSVSYQSRSVSI